jgi:hypothetical protein
MKKLSAELLISVFVILSIMNFIRIDLSSHSASDTLRPFFIQTTILAIVIYFVFKGIVRRVK